MLKFSYSATNKQGKTQSGSISAESRQSAIQTLIAQGFKPLIVKEVKKGIDLNHLSLAFIKRKKVKTTDMVIFTRQLSTMVSAGVPLIRSLMTLKEQTNNVYFQDVIDDLAKSIEGGLSFSEALAQHKQVFSDVYVNMVAAGEVGGILDDILKRLAIQMEKEASIKKKIRSASIYPIVLFSIAIIAFFGLMIFIVPKFGDIIKDLGGEDAELPVYTRVMLAFSGFMVKFWYVFVLAIAGGLYGLRRYIKTPKGRIRYHRLLLKIPIMKKVIVKVAIARFSRMFASMMGAGVGVLDTLTVISRSLGNAVIEAELNEAIKEVRNGKQLSEPLSQSQVFPPIVAQMLAVGEETGQIDTILVKVADFYEEEVDALVDGLASVIEPLMIVVLGGMVGLVALSVMGPLTSVTQNIGG